jgi:hypothetical protein
MAKRSLKRREKRRRAHSKERSGEPRDEPESAYVPGGDSQARDQPSADKFQITIASLDMGQEGLCVDREIDMAKAALLYADHVTLASPKAIFAASTVAMAYGDRETQDEVALGLLEQVGGEGLGEVYSALRRKRNRSIEETRVLAQLDTVLEKTRAGMAENIGPTADESRFDELFPAIEYGLLEIHPLGADQVTEADDFIDAILESLQELLRQSVSPSASAHPMYDDSAGDMLKVMLKDGGIDNPVLRLANEVGVACDFIDTVEAFPNASMDVILDVRERLRGPLIRFRAAVASASAEIGSDDSIFDDRFHARVAETYRRTVAPELESIREGLHELDALPTLRRTAKTTAQTATKAATMATLGLLAGHLDMNDLTAIATALGVGAKATADERAFRAAVRKAQKENRFFWLYEAGRQIPE